VIYVIITYSGNLCDLCDYSTQRKFMWFMLLYYTTEIYVIYVIITHNGNLCDLCDYSTQRKFM